MSEDDREKAEAIRRALEEFLDRLARAVVAGLTRPGQVDPPEQARSQECESKRTT